MKERISLKMMRFEVCRLLILAALSGAVAQIVACGGSSSTVVSQGFTLSASPSSVSVTQGSSNTTSITVNPSGGFSGSVSLAVTSTLPSGVTASFAPTSTATTSTLTFTASSSATPGTTAVTVTGTSGAITQTTTISLTVSSSQGAQCSPPAPVTTSPSVANGVGVVVPNTFMDLHVGSSSLITSGDVTVPYGSIRLWDTSTGWAQINSAQGSFDFTTLDGFVSAAQGAGVDILYNLARTPTWASSNPTDSTCSYDTSEQGGPGQCDPPSDLNPDGSGTDQDWINWVTAVATRNATQYNNQIKYFEIWNEWNISLFWTGTPAQLVRMEQDARCVVEGPPPGQSCNSNSTFPSGTGLNPQAEIVTPSPVGAHTDLNEVQLKLSAYFGTTVPGNSAPGGTFADVIGFHGYVSTEDNSVPCPNPEEETTVVGDLNLAVTAAGETGKPWFDTENSWGKAPDEGFTDPDRQAAFLARFVILQASMGVAREYWYRWDATQTYGGALWTPSAGITEAGTADGEVYNWITGKSFVSPGCTASGSVWTCPLSHSSGWNGLAVWDAAQDCDNGTCTYSTFTVPAGGYTQYLDVTGNTTSVTGTTVQIGAKPILLETGTLPPP